MVFDPFAGLQLAQDFILFMVQLRRDELEDGSTDDLLWLIAEEPGSSLVPTRNDAIQVLTDDGVIGGIDDSCEVKTRIESSTGGSGTGIGRGAEAGLQI
jgi:hypothetical protein